MSSLLTHVGGKVVNRSELDLIEVPPPTDSYQPVSHYHLAETFLTISRDILSGYVLVSEAYALARNGNQLFALLRFKGPDSELGMAVAFRNSYDRSMSVGLAIGANVFICDNLALHGEIAIIRKHTKNVWDSLEDTAITTLYKGQKKYQKTVEDATLLRALPMENRQAFEMMGILFGEGVVGPRQLAVLKKEWLQPSHEEFVARTQWSFFNAATEALKSCPPTTIMEKHIKAYDTIASGI